MQDVVDCRLETMARSRHGYSGGAHRQYWRRQTLRQRRQAGKGKDQKSKQGNRELHSILYFLAIQQVQVAKVSEKPRNPVFHDYYHRKIAEGKTKKQALVCVMRRLVNIVYGMMKHRTAYVMPELPEKEAV